MITKKAQANMETTAVAQDKQHLVAKGKMHLNALHLVYLRFCFSLTITVDADLYCLAPKSTKMIIKV